MSSQAQAPDQGSAVRNFYTRDAEIARQHIQHFYGDAARVERHEKHADFAMRIQIARVGAATLAAAHFCNWRLTRQTLDSIIISFPITGLLRTRCGGRQYDHQPLSHASVARPFETHAASVAKGDGIALTLPREGLLERIERLTDANYDKALLSRMVSQIDATTPLGTSLAHAMKTAMAEVASLDCAGLGAFASHGHSELLCNLAVGCLFPEITKVSNRRANDCGPAKIRRARDYIRHHAAEPIELTRLASELGISMRALQENFQRCYACAPRQYLRTCRLDLARRQLLTSGQPKCVTEIALACGFGDLSHFSAKYRDAYGELPSETLRATRDRA